MALKLFRNLAHAQLVIIKWNAFEKSVLLIYFLLVSAAFSLFLPGEPLAFENVEHIEYVGKLATFKCNYFRQSLYVSGIGTGDHRLYSTKDKENIYLINKIKCRVKGPSHFGGSNWRQKTVV